MKLFGSLSRLTSLLLRKNSRNVTIQLDANTTYTADRVITLPAGNADRTLVSTADTLITNVKYVAKNGNDSTGDGSFAKPYLTIQAAINAASAGGSVIVMPGNYTEDLTINKQMNLYGFGAYSIQRSLVLGKLSITSTSTIGVNHLGFQTTDKNALEVTSSGAVRFESCTFERVGGGGCVYVSGNLTGGIYFVNCYVSGNFENASSIPFPVVVMGTTSTEMKVVTTTTTSYTRVEFCSEIGPVTHTAGGLVIANCRGILKDGSGNCITSTAALNATNIFALVNVALQQEDGTYGKINKTGTCYYALSLVNRSTAIDVLTGTRISFAVFADDISANRTPTNYTAATADIKAHLAGVDTAIGGKEPTITTLSAAKGGLATNASAFTGVVKASSGVFSAATLVNADVSASAAIDGTKIAPNFGSQTVSTSGSAFTQNLIFSGGAGNTNYLYMPTNTEPGNPGSGKIYVFCNASSQLCVKDGAGTVTILGSGGGGIMPNYTTAQRDALTPSAGQVIYNTTDNRFQGYVTGTGWVNLHGWGA